MQILHGDSLAILPTLAANSIDAIVTDPPYCLDSVRQRFGSATAKPSNPGADGRFGRLQRGFMGKLWDDDIAFRSDIWRECLRILKPGGHLACFGGSRTHHRVWCAIEDAGFELRDTLMWLYAQGFPKSLDVSKALDKHLGAEREVLHRSNRHGGGVVGAGTSYELPPDIPMITAPATPQAEQWCGWGTALKPSHEPILLARKPLIGTVAQTVLEHGTGGINVDACRVGKEQLVNHGMSSLGVMHDDNWQPNQDIVHTVTGRWPPNLLHDGSPEVVECFPVVKPRGNINPGKGGGGMYGHGPCINTFGSDGITGSAARFFPALGYSDDERRVLYCPKASKRDRAGSKHPTIKPIRLIEWLCNLICPPNGTILDPFAGSGTTGQAATNLGFDCILIEREAEYIADIHARQADDVIVIAP